MSATRTEFGEHDVVALLAPVEGWPTGTTGTIISNDPIYKLVEISNELGEEIDSLEVRTEELRLVWKCPPPA